MEVIIEIGKREEDCCIFTALRFHGELEKDQIDFHD